MCNQIKGVSFERKGELKQDTQGNTIEGYRRSDDKK